jgi:hypothetical protein
MAVIQEVLKKSALNPTALTPDVKLHHRTHLATEHVSKWRRVTNMPVKSPSLGPHSRIGAQTRQALHCR